MFRKRQKKYFPPGTFTPTPARVCAIIQLCLAFSALLWNISDPFVGEIFTLKSRLLFYQEAMGLPPSGQTNLEKKEQLTRNSERFLALPKHTKEQLLSDFEVIQKQLQRSFWDKLTSVLGLFAHKISPYELAWIFFSVAISILLLKRVEGASQAVWLLPLLAALYAADSQWYGRNDPHAFEAKLFPSENELVSNYMDSPLSEDIFEQQRQMMQGWKRYLVLKWARQMPSSDQAAFDRQVEEGEFDFYFSSP